jgi:hypothetical protein
VRVYVYHVFVLRVLWLALDGDAWLALLGLGLVGVGCVFWSGLAMALSVWGVVCGVKDGGLA